MLKVVNVIFGVFSGFMNFSRKKQDWEATGYFGKIIYLIMQLVIAGIALVTTYYTIYIPINNSLGLLSIIVAIILGLIAFTAILQSLGQLLISTLIAFSAIKQRKTKIWFNVIMAILTLFAFAGFIAGEVLIILQFIQ